MNGGKRILLVEDDAGLQTLFASVLRAEGYIVVASGDGLTALSLYAPGAFDAVICDAQLPVIDGPTTIRGLRKLSPDLPIIAISGGGDAILADMIAAGATTAVRKPVASEHLLTLVHQVTRGGMPPR